MRAPPSSSLAWPGGRHLPAAEQALPRERSPPRSMRTHAHGTAKAHVRVQHGGVCAPGAAAVLTAAAWLPPSVKAVSLTWWTRRRRRQSRSETLRLEADSTGTCRQASPAGAGHSRGRPGRSAWTLRSGASRRWGPVSKFCLVSLATQPGPVSAAAQGTRKSCGTHHRGSRPARLRLRPTPPSRPPRRR
jgi:hypothetical protein